MALNTATIIKGAVGVLGVSSLGIGGYYAIQALNKETIESKLKEEGFEKLASASPEWENIFKNYQTVSESVEVLKFSGAKISNKEELQKRCEEILNQNFSEESVKNNFLPKAKKWCIVPTTVSKALKGRKILGTDKTKDQEEQADWNKKIEDYTKIDNSNKIDGLNFEGGAIVANNANTQHREKFKDACKKLNEKKSYEGDYETAIRNSEDWCTLPQ